VEVLEESLLAFGEQVVLKITAFLKDSSIFMSLGSTFSVDDE
jgi:hypothetical protein